MPAPSKSNIKRKTEKIFHPSSRKAGQLSREALRKTRLVSQLGKRGKKQIAKADRYSVFLHALDPELHCLSLQELHKFVQEVWLTRHDLELEEERSARRKGRPKSSREHQLEELKRYEAEEYRTGLELPDLTSEHYLGLFRQWDGNDVTYLNIMRFIRICGEFPDVVHAVKPGRDGERPSQVDDDMEFIPLERVGSTMLGMDEIGDT